MITYIHHKLKLLAVTILAVAVMGLGANSALWAQSTSKKTATKKSAQSQSGKKTKADTSSSKKSAKTKKKAAAVKKETRKEAAQKLDWPQNVLHLVGSGAVLVMDPHAEKKSQRELYAFNAEKQYVPASILKIVTSGVALETLGPDFRFKTEFFLTKDNDLWIKGYGDPYLVSEELSIIVEHLKRKGLKKVRDIGIDNSYFGPGLALDGNSQTSNPYDAYNCALGVNFNTVAFNKNKKGTVTECGEVLLTPTALEMARKTKRRGNVWLNISESPQRAELHAAEMFQAHLEKTGLKVSGNLIVGREVPEKAKLLYTHESRMTLEALVKELLKYSNNYVTNQIFLAMGVEEFGAPASLEKSQKVVEEYFAKHGLPYFSVGDGSGLSRSTKLTAGQMAAVLAVFEPDRKLLEPHKELKQVECKTGTMSDIQTLAGYIERPEDPDRPLSFVILLNGQGYERGTRDAILEMITAKFTPSRQ